MSLTLNCWENANSGGTAVSSLVVNKPTSSSVAGDSPKNVAVGDMLLIVCGNDDATDTAQWNDSTLKPTGFTLIAQIGGAASDCHAAAFYKIADGTEGSSFTIPSEASQEMWASCILISSSIGSPALHLTGSAVADETPSPLAITGVTNTVYPTINFYLATFDGGDAGAFAISGTGWAERQELFAGTASGDACGVWGTQPMSGAGASGTASVTPTTSDGMYGIQFSIKEVITFLSIRQDIINGLDSAQSEATGWNAEVRDKEVVGAVVRTSATVVTITLTAQSGYNITAQETITVTVPASALTGAEAIIATPTFTVAPGAGSYSRAVAGSLTFSNNLISRLVTSKRKIEGALCEAQHWLWKRFQVRKRLGKHGLDSALQPCSRYGVPSSLQGWKL